MRKLPIGVQVYSVREEAEADFPESLKAFKAMGYDGVELAGMYGYSPEEIKKIADDAGLKVISAHVSIEDLDKDLEGCVKGYAQMGCKYIAIPYLGEEYHYGGARFKELLEKLPKIARECDKYGIKLLYHNHDFEFKKTDKGTYALDELYVAVPVLQTEFDTCWVKVAGEDPAEYLRIYKGRSPVIHLKDFTPPNKLCVLGEGVMDLPGVLDAAVANGTEWIIIEQDDHYERTPMEDMKLNMEYLGQIGWE